MAGYRSHVWGTRFVLIFCVVILVALPVWGQLAATGTINGTVNDPSGAAVPQAKVVATNTGTNLRRLTQTDTNGSFVFASLPVGHYTVTISKSGFKTYNATDVVLHPGIVSNVNVSMQIGNVSTHVTVSGAAMQVQTTTSQVSSQVSSEQVATLPLDGRNYQSLSALMPGVTNISPGASLNQGGFLTSNVISVNGMGQSGTLYTVDGIWDMNTGNMTQTTITPNPDTIQEVRVLQNNYSVKYNLFGGSVMLIHTKSGVKTFHGNAFEYLRNDALDARNFFSPTVPPLKQNIFGYTLGGPIYIPHHFNRKKQKLFFFWSQQWSKQHIGSVKRGATPTAAMRNGTFNSPITDPSTGLPFPQTSPGVYQIPQQMISQDSTAFLNAMAPLPNNPGAGFLNYLNLKPQINNTRDDDIKVDYDISQKLRLMGEYLDDRQLNGNPNNTFISNPFSVNTDPITTDNQLAQLQLTATISDSMVNTIGIAMNNYVGNLSLAGTIAQSQIPGFHENLPFGNFYYATLLPQINLSQGYATLGVPTNLPIPHASDLEDTFMDNWSWLRGKHYIQAGLNIVLGTKRQNAFGTGNGAWGFSGQFTGNAVADFLLGDASSFSQNSNRPRFYAHYRIISPYVEDSWKVSRRLTLSGGIRWEHMPPGHDQQAFATIFDPARYDPTKAPIVNNNGTITPTANFDATNGLIRNGVNGIPINFTNEYVNYFAPSVGFAWDIFGDGKTSLRGGYGFSYAASPIQNYCLNVCTVNPPLVQSLTFVTPSFPDPIGAAVKPAGAPTLSSEDLSIRLASVQTFSLSMQHQFRSGWLVSVAGAGNISRHLGAKWNRNQPLPDAPYDFNPAINAGNVFTYTFAPYLGYGAINTKTSEENAFWNALEVDARHPVGHNLFVSVAYTWQHDLAEAPGSVLINNQSGVQDTYHPGNDYGNATVSPFQILSLSGIWSLPWYHNAGGWKGAALGGWKYSDIATIQSGFSMNPGLSVPHKGLATRPNRVANTSTSGPKTVQDWFNTAAFSAPLAGYFGSAAPGSITGPGYIGFDMALYKDFDIAEGKTIQFRSEFFNTFNHTNFSGVSTAFGSGNYGQVTSARNPRILEFALRLQF